MRGMHLPPNKSLKRPPTILFLLLSASLVCACSSEPLSAESASQKEAGFQHDADLARLEHLEYWTGLIEEFEAKTGRFPLSERLTQDNSIGLVRIATHEQSKYLDPESEEYLSALDNNHGGRFDEFKVSDFVSELENGLSRSIDEKYDIQRVPTSSPVWYNYFVTRSGYVVWIPCITCGVTEISTLLLDGITPTVNIASAGMKDSVTKAFTRSEMLSHPTFKQWKSKQYIKEDFVREREMLYRNESKKRRQSVDNR